MSIEFDVMNAYHRAIGRHEQRTGESFPLVRHTCVYDCPKVVRSTSAFDEEIVARWSQDRAGRIRIKLVGATR
jgi:hypothetical protein